MQVKRAVLARTYSVPNVGEGCRLENEQRTTRHVCYTHTVTDVCVITHFITRPHLALCLVSQGITARLKCYSETKQRKGIWKRRENKQK